MSKLLSDLTADLAVDVPAVDDVPSAEQYESCVKEAVGAFSERCGTEKIATLNVTPGTATYNLPADFLEMIVLESFQTTDGVMLTSQGIVPLNASFEERFTIRGGQITFHPTPTYTMARDMRYKAGWVLTQSDEDYDDLEYADMGEREARIVLIKARQLAMEKISRAQAAAGGMKYSFGAVSVDKTADAEAQTKAMFKLQGEFVEECNKYNGTRSATW